MKMESDDLMNNEYDERHAQRLEKTIKFLRPCSSITILDLGCYNGEFGELLRKRYPKSKIYLADIEKPNYPFASSENVYFVSIKDLNKYKLPFDDNSFDLVTNLEMIEHLCNLDNLFSEVHRVLKPGGILVISTPNLGSWVNRIFLLFGYFPMSVSISVKSRYLGKGEFLQKPPLKSLEDASFGYHVKTYTFGALKTLLELHNFKIIRRKGFYAFESRHSNIVIYTINIVMEKFFPFMAQAILIEARAEK